MLLTSFFHCRVQNPGIQLKSSWVCWVFCWSCSSGWQHWPVQLLGPDIQFCDGKLMVAMMDSHQRSWECDLLPSESEFYELIACSSAGQNSLLAGVRCDWNILKLSTGEWDASFITTKLQFGGLETRFYGLPSGKLTWKLKLNIELNSLIHWTGKGTREVSAVYFRECTSDYYHYLYLFMYTFIMRMMARIMMRMMKPIKSIPCSSIEKVEASERMWKDYVFIPYAKNVNSLDSFAAPFIVVESHSSMQWW